MLSNSLNTHKTVEKHLEVNVPDPVGDLLLLGLPRHPLQSEVQLRHRISTR